MSTIADLVIKLSAHTKGAENDIKNFSGGVGKSMDTAGGHADNMSKKTGRLGGAMKGLGIVAGGAALVGVAALGAVMVGGVKEAIAHEKALAQTEAVVKSTGGVAKVTSKHVVGLADSIEKMSGMDDLAIQSGENMLLTFTNVRNGVGKNNQVFDQATRTLADMSTALGTDPQTQAIQLGKALNDPIKGVSALSRVGVTFTAQQKELIKGYMEHGQAAKAQGVILGELQKEFGGSAAAAGQTMGGQLNILKAHFADVQQMIGEKVLPILNDLIQWAITNWPTFQKYAEIAMQVISDAWTNQGKPTFDAIMAVMTVVVGWVRTNWDTISGIFKSVFQIITGVIDAFIAIFKGDWGALWTAVKQIVSGAFDLIVGVIKLAGPLLLLAAKAVGAKIIDGIKDGVEGLADAAVAGVKAIPGALTALLTLLFNAAKGAGGKLWDGIKEATKDIAGDVADYFGKIPDKLTSLLGSLKSAAGDLGKGIITGIGDGLAGLGAKLKELIIAPINAVISGWNNIEFSIPKIDTHIPGVGKVGGGSVGTPNIPLLAEGGIVTGPTLAILGEAGPEAVVPLGVKKNFSTGAGSLAGSDVGGDIVMVVDGVEIGRIARKELTRTGRRNVGLVFS